MKLKIFLSRLSWPAFCLIMLLPTTIQPRVSYQAHAWGFLAGFILAVLLAGWLPVRRPTRVTMPSLDNHH